MNLTDMIDMLGEDRVKSILSSFECPKNPDVEAFIRYKAIEFSKRNLAKTNVVYWVEGKEKELIGYYTIAPKYFSVSKNAVSSKVFHRIKQHGDFNVNTNSYIVSAPLIGQLGKNFNAGNNYLISGDELLKMALEKVKSIQREVGGKFTYLECEDKEKLIHFYESNGFQIFGKRKLDKDETDLDGEYLLQLMKYID